MTLKARVIPCLDVKDGRVVKGVSFVNLVDAGDPVEAAIAYDAAGADELCFLDITASSDNRETIIDVVARTAVQVVPSRTAAEHVVPAESLDRVRSVEPDDDVLAVGADQVVIAVRADDGGCEPIAGDGVARVRDWASADPDERGEREC